MKCVRSSVEKEVDRECPAKLERRERQRNCVPSMKVDRGRCRLEHVRDSEASCRDNAAADRETLKQAVKLLEGENGRSESTNSWTFAESDTCSSRSAVRKCCGKVEEFGRRTEV